MVNFTLWISQVCIQMEDRPVEYFFLLAIENSHLKAILWLRFVWFPWELIRRFVSIVQFLSSFVGIRYLSLNSSCSFLGHPVCRSSLIYIFSTFHRWSSITIFQASSSSVRFLLDDCFVREQNFSYGWLFSREIDAKDTLWPVSERASIEKRIVVFSK